MSARDLKYNLRCLEKTRIEACDDQRGGQMRLKSRGLGRKELVLDFREYAVIREEDEVIIVGTIRDPVNWDFSIRMCEDDVVGMSKLILCRPMIGILLRSFFKRRKQHHWTQEQSEHIAEGRQRLVDAQQKAAARTRTREETRRERTQLTGESN